MAKLQIKSEKPLLLEDFFSGRGANPLTLTLTVQNSATPPLREKGERESLYLYIYKYKNILLTFLYFSTPSQGEEEGCGKSDCKCQRQQGMIKSKDEDRGENYDFGRRKLNLCAPKAMDFRRVNLLNAFLLKIASLRIPKFGGFKK